MPARESGSRFFIPARESGSRVLIPSAGKWLSHETLRLEVGGVGARK